MANNLLENGGFEADWGEEASHWCLVRDADGSQRARRIGEIFTPPGWVTWFRHEPGEWDQPEVRDAWAKLDPRRVHSGQKAQLLFTFYRKHDGGFFQRLDLDPGTRVRLSAWAHAWSNHDLAGYEACLDDPRCSCGVGHEVYSALEGAVAPPTGEDEWADAVSNFVFRVGIDPTGQEDPWADTVVWGQGLHAYNGYAEVPPVEAVVGVEGRVTVFLRSTTQWRFKHNDAYWDDVSLVVVETEQRWYARTIHLLPQDATQGEAASVLAEARPRRQSITWSVDDALVRAPELMSRRVHVWDVERIAGSRQALREWAERYYPPQPQWVWHEFADPQPPEPEPVPDRLLIGFQQQQARDYRDEFIARVKPPVWLLINGFEEAAHIKALSPDTEVVLRHVDNDWKSYIYASDIDAAAERWLTHYGQTLLDQAEHIDYIVGLNEYIATDDYDALHAMPHWIEALIRVLEREGWPARLIGGNVPVGNPQTNDICDQYEIPRQVPLMIPAARLLADNDCLLGYHAYWGARKLADGSYYCTFDDGQDYYYSMRALVDWDPVFTAAGVHVSYAFTEGGPIYISEHDGMTSSHAGWRWRGTYDGDVDAAIASVLRFQVRVRGWNRWNEDRGRWLAMFLHGGFDEWRRFDWAGEASEKLGEALRG